MTSLPVPPWQGLSQQAEVRCAQWASARDVGTQLLQLMDSEAPHLQERLAQLEQSWADVTSALPALQSWVKQVGNCRALSLFNSFLKGFISRIELTKNYKVCNNNEKQPIISVLLRARC